MKVGVFDSGIGGLTILQSLVQEAPQYDYLYLGDSARTPYGNRSFETILEFTRQGIEYLFSNDCLVIIIACNTASAKALRTIQMVDLPKKSNKKRVLGIIRPSAETIPTLSKNLAIWGTQGTIQSQSYVIEIEKQSSEVKIVQQACPMLVPLIENTEINNEGCNYFIQKYWQLTLAQNSNIDTLLLACTHYPLLQERIKLLLPDSIAIYNQGDFIGPSWKNYLDRHPELESQLHKNQSREYLSTDNPQYFDQLAKILLGLEISSKKAYI